MVVRQFKYLLPNPYWVQSWEILDKGVWESCWYIS